MALDYKRDPMGQCFKQNMHQLLNDLPFATFIYMDDLIVVSVDMEQHRSFGLERRKDKCFLLNRKNIELGRVSLKFLGHIVNAHEISISPE